MYEMPYRYGPGADVYSPVLQRMVKLTPAMQRLVRALDEYGHVDPTRDFGRGTNTNTIVGLINRGILRESKTLRGVHHPAHTPAQVWDEAHAEDERRLFERCEHHIDPERWLTTINDDGDETHVRTARAGYPIEVEKAGHRFWFVRINGHTPMSASGTWQEARAAADRFEREQAHGAARDEYREVTRAAREADSAAYQRELQRELGLNVDEHPAAVAMREQAAELDAEVAARVQARRDADHAEAFDFVKREQHIAQSGTAHVRNDCPALKVGGCMKCTAPATVRAARGERVACYERPEGWGQSDGMLGAPEAELTRVVAEIEMDDPAQYVITPAPGAKPQQAHKAPRPVDTLGVMVDHLPTAEVLPALQALSTIAQARDAALAAMAELKAHHTPTGFAARYDWIRERLDRIEQALRAQ